MHCVGSCQYDPHCTHLCVECSRVPNTFLILLATFTGAGVVSGFEDKVIFSLGGGILVWILVRFFYKYFSSPWYSHVYFRPSTLLPFEHCARACQALELLYILMVIFYNHLSSMIADLPVGHEKSICRGYCCQCVHLKRGPHTLKDRFFLWSCKSCRCAPVRVSVCVRRPVRPRR